MWCCVGYYAKRLAHIIYTTQTITFHVSKLLLSCYFFRCLYHHCHCRCRHCHHTLHPVEQMRTLIKPISLTLLQKKNLFFSLYFFFYYRACYSDSFRSFFLFSIVLFCLLHFLSIYADANGLFLTLKRDERNADHFLYACACDATQHHLSCSLHQMFFFFKKRKWNRLKFPQERPADDLIDFNSIRYSCTSLNIFRIQRMDSLIYSRSLSCLRIHTFWLRSALNHPVK